MRLPGSQLPEFHNKQANAEEAGAEGRHHSAAAPSRDGQPPAGPAGIIPANDAEVQEPLPDWQKAFMLGPTVRFTRTPEKSVPKRVAAPQMPTAEEIRAILQPMEAAQPFHAAQPLPASPSPQASQPGQTVQTDDASVKPGFATSAPGARALVDELTQALRNRAALLSPRPSPIERADAAAVPAVPVTQPIQAREPSPATPVSQAAQMPHATIVAQSRAPFSYGSNIGMTPGVYQAPARPQNEAGTVAQPTTAEAARLAGGDQAAAPAAAAPLAARMAASAHLPDHLIWEMMSLGASDGTEPPSSRFAPVQPARPITVAPPTAAAPPIRFTPRPAAMQQPSQPQPAQAPATPAPRAFTPVRPAPAAAMPVAAAPQTPTTSPFFSRRPGPAAAAPATASAPPPAALLTAKMDIESLSPLRFYRQVALRPTHLPPAPPVLPEKPADIIPISAAAMAAMTAPVSPIAAPVVAQTAPAKPAAAAPIVRSASSAPVMPVVNAAPAIAAAPIAASPASPQSSVLANPSASPLATPLVTTRAVSPLRSFRVDTPVVDAYEFPSIDLLQAGDNSFTSPITQESLEQSAGLLESVLEDFGIKGEIIDVRPGPVVTLYEFEPAPGVKSSRVIGLSEDIARSMSALSARVAVVPGRNVIGIELPNPVRETVYLRELIESHTYANTGFRLPLCLGKTIGGEPVVAELAKMPHLLVAGTTGSGKSVAINTMILSLLYRYKPENCRLIMIDPKMLELSVYDGIPHLLSPVVTDPKKAVLALKWAVREMEDRYRKMSRLSVRNIDGFNARVASASASGEVISINVQVGFDRQNGEPVFEQQDMDLTPLPYIVVIVDEMADLMMVAGKEIEGAIQRLAQMARAAGIHIIMATQRPSVDVITGTIKANFPTRISFQVTSKIDSRTILGEQGAENLLGQGDMLHMMGGGRIARVHGPFVSDQEVERIVAHLKTQGQPAYLGSVTEDEDEEVEIEEEQPVFDKSSMGEEDRDELYEQAIKVVMRDRKCSTSYIQRRLSVGYNRAASLVERMEKDGLVGPANHVGKREILSQRAQDKTADKPLDQVTEDDIDGHGEDEAG